MTARKEGGGRFRRAARRARWILPPPSQVVGAQGIKGGYRLVSDLWRYTRHSRNLERAIQLPDARHTADFIHDAEDLGLAPAEIERRIAARRVDTRRSALLALGIAVVLFVGWTWNMLFALHGGGRWLAVFEFLPFCAASLLYAFHSSWMNWQLRIRRRGTALEYLTTDAGFWPG